MRVLTDGPEPFTTPHPRQYDKKVTELDAKTKQYKEELDKLLPKIGNLVDDTCVRMTENGSIKRLC